MLRSAALLFACTVTPSVAAEDDLSLLQTNFRTHKLPRSSFASAVIAAITDLDGLSLDEKPVLAAMAAAPLDASTQASGCRQLAAAIMARAEELAKPSVVEPIVKAIKNNVADRAVVETCFFALSAFRATFDRPRTLAINNGTHIADAVAAALRQYPHDREMQKDGLLWVGQFSNHAACETQAPFVDAGCIDLIWDALDYFTGREYSDVQMSAWQSFSRHSGCQQGASAIANRGGKHVGARRTVQFLREAIGNKFHLDPMHGGGPINLQYEIMTAAQNLLEQVDDSFDDFVESGYGPLVMSLMRDQPDERSANERACAALSVLSRKATVRASLVAGGALELIAKAMARFKGKDHRMLVEVNAEVGDYYPVLPACDAALRNFADDSTEVLDTLLNLGVLETYDTMRDDMLSKPSMHTLPKLLSAREGEGFWRRRRRRRR